MITERLRAGDPRENPYRVFCSDPNVAPVGVATVRLDATRCYTKAKQEGRSFFLTYLHHLLTVINQIPEFGYRLHEECPEDKFLACDLVHAGITVARPDHSFGFAFIESVEDEALFHEQAAASIAACKAANDLVGSPRKDQIYVTVTPLMDFTSLVFNPTGPRDIPRIGFGKCVSCQGRYEMSMAIQYHHGFQDGYHVGLLAQLMQAAMDS